MKNSNAVWNSRLKSNEYSQMVMPSGKHKGQQVKDLPTDYIKWYVMNVNGHVAQQLSRELIKRGEVR